MSDTGSAIYSGLAVYGRVNVIIGTVVSGIIILILLIMGIKFFYTKDTQVASTTGKIFNIDSANSTFSINYSVGDNKYVIQGSGKGVVDGQIINILYDPSNPSNARQASSMSKHSTGGIMIIAAVVLAIITGLVLYFTLKYKEFAAIEGGFTAANQLRQLI